MAMEIRVRMKNFCFGKNENAIARGVRRKNHGNKEEGLFKLICNTMWYNLL
jgi:hypothetical protein